MTIQPSQSAPRLAIIDYGMGNLRSVLKAWQHEGADAFLAASPKAVSNADALIFPGQGAIVDTMRLLNATGFDAMIKDWIEQDKPFFGICLGLQALFEHSEEGDVPGLGIFKGTVNRFPKDTSLKVPHMGWNTVQFNADAPLTENLISDSDQFYFVHSYYVASQEQDTTWFTADYGLPFIAGIQRGRCFATQFHPEKSQAKGLQLFRNFLTSL